jgi:CPA2 family monovalent cation:H+ antiporter-2
MLASPLLDFLGRRLAALLDRSPPAGAGAHDPSAADLPRVDHVVIAGFGRTGRIVAEALDSHGAAWVAVDRDPALAAAARADGRPVLFGDAGRADLLDRLGLEGAAALVVTLDDLVAAERAVAAARARRPDLPIFARARDAHAAEALARLGAREVLPESLEPSLHLAQHALTALGAPPSQTLDTLEAMRDAARARG